MNRILIAICIASSLVSSCEIRGHTVRIAAHEFKFSPDRIELPAGQSIQIILRNQGRELHVFHAPFLNDPSVRFSWRTQQTSLQAGGAIRLPPGGSAAFAVVFPPGIYPFRCWIRGHAGMEGSLIVKDNSSEQA